MTTHTDTAITGKVVVITGASSGLGEATARYLAERGATVVLGARRVERLQTLVDEITRAGGKASARATDVTDPAQVQALVDAAVEQYGRALTDGQMIDLGGRTVQVVFTPGHTPGATTFIDKDAGYGFSGDSFGSGNLLLSGTFSTLIAICQKMANLMEKHGIKHLYPGHFNGRNFETKQRLDDEVTISKDVLSGKMKGEPNPRAMLGLNLVVTAFGVRINYGEKSLQ